MRSRGRSRCALDYAHRQGVVHRDIKPENILLSTVRRWSPTSASRGRRGRGRGALTETGLAVGTPVYMSPEQAAGERELDGRSDIYSLGCVLYEMLAGEAPFGGPSARAIAARHSLEPVPSDPGGPPNRQHAIERVIHRAMAKVPADRFATAAEFAEALAITDRQEVRGRTSGSPRGAGVAARRFGGPRGAVASPRSLPRGRCDRARWRGAKGPDHLVGGTAGGHATLPTPPSCTSGRD